ncbi:MAG: preprotein translocase subunit SecE [Coriobacteriia bacterium]|nr:preprotein translocase subunit SecE [Coriobacteriia bacterium]
MAQASKASRPNVFARFGRYVRDVKAEMKRVVWPNRAEVLNSSVVVVMTLAFFIVFTFAIDSLSSWLFLDLLAGIGR